MAFTQNWMRQVQSSGGLWVVDGRNAPFDGSRVEFEQAPSRVWVHPAIL